jgi:peptide/nickel transport system substrate-binding protein
MRFHYGVSVALALGVGLAAHGALAGKSDDNLIWATDREVDVAVSHYNNVRETVIIRQNVWDTLLYRNPETFEYEPLLATSYEWIDDLTLEFTLREGVKFHNGAPFSADDVVGTLNHIVHPDSGILTRTNVDWIDRAEKIDDFTVRIHTKHPFPPALEFLANPLAILPGDIWETAKVGAGGKPDFATVEPIGTGPYKIVRVVPGEGVWMEKNPDYFDGPKPAAQIGKLTFRTIPDKQAQVAELLTGGVDWIWDVPKDQAERLGQTGRVQVVNAPTMRVAYIGMDRTGRSGDTPFTDIRVRQAVAHAIDRETIARELDGPASEVVHAPCYPSQVGCTMEVPRYEYDPDKARALLAEAGYPNGFETTLYGYRERHFTEAVMGYLAEVGIQSNLQWLQYRALRGLVWEDKTPFYHMTWGSGSINDISAFTSLFFGGGRDDYCRDEKVIEHIKKGDSTIDPAERNKAYHVALERIMEEVCWVPMFAYGKYYPT